MALFAVSSFYLNSGGDSHVTLEIYRDLESATAAFETGKKSLGYEDQDDKGTKEETVVAQNGMKTISVWEDGCWKRPCGYELITIPSIGDGNILYTIPIRAYPDERIRC